MSGDGDHDEDIWGPAPEDLSARDEEVRRRSEERFMAARLQVYERALALVRSPTSSGSMASA